MTIVGKQTKAKPISTKKMMRRTALQCLRSTRKQSKSNPFCLQNVPKSTTASKPKCQANRLTDRCSPLSNNRSHTMLWSPTRPLHVQHLSSLGEFTVRKSEPELLGPVKPTRRELKPLSNVDDQDITRCKVPLIHFYRYNPSMEGKDPAKVIREALANALVFYYPLAGRITEGADRKLSVDCAGQGVLFVEADADVELAQLGDPLRPPFPWVKKFLDDVPASQGLINAPLFLIQVTRLKCGGFVFAFRYNHIIGDGGGLVQFFAAVGEIAQGAHTPSVIPIWRRELLSAPNPQPKICTSPDEKMEQPIITVHNPNMIQQSFFFGPSELSAIRGLVPDHVRPYSTTFEILTAFLWRCRTTALPFDPEDTVRLKFAVSARDKTNRTIPVGYYGNTVILAGAESSATRLCEGPMEYALGLVKQAKEQGSKKCASWRTDPPATVGGEKLYYGIENAFIVTDISRLGFGDLDFGWGKAVYAGFTEIEFDSFAVYVPFRNHNGEDGILVHMCLEGNAIGRFENEVNNLVTVE